MFNKFLKFIIILTLIIVTVTFVYTSIMTLFFHVDYEKNYLLGCGTYYFTFALVLWAQSRKNFYLNHSLLYLLLIFSFCAGILGELFNFYYKFALWDNMLHVLAGILITVLMLNILHSLSGYDLMQHYPKLVIFLFIVGCTVSIGVVWEVYEFSMDSIFNYNMQKTFFVDTTTNFQQYVNSANLFVAPSLVDTMYDLIAEGVTTILCAFLLVLYGPLKFYNHFLAKKNHVE